MVTLVNDPEREIALNWIRSRPASIKALMRRFPPACYVRGLVPLAYPAPGITGQVMSYFEPALGQPEALVSVQAPDPIMGIEGRAQCQLEWLKVVGYWRNKWGELQDPAWIAGILGRSDGRDDPRH